MGKTGFDKATSKMFGEFGSSVKISEGNAGSRLSREERERMREEEEEKERSREREQRDEERRQLVKDLVDLNVIKPEEPAGGAAVVEKQGRGRPLKNSEVGEHVLMNFRVGKDFRQKLKVMAAQQGCTVVDLFDEAFGLLFKKYRV